VSPLLSVMPISPTSFILSHQGTIDKLGIDKMLDRNVQKDVGLQVCVEILENYPKSNVITSLLVVYERIALLFEVHHHLCEVIGGLFYELR